MASITIRNLDQELKMRLRIRAAERGKSMEDEARDILRTALAEQSDAPRNLAESIRGRLSKLGGVELPGVEREAMRPPPSFD